MRHVQQQQLEYDQADGALVKRTGGGDVAVREDGSVVVAGVRSLAGEKLRGRSWRGLVDEGPGGEEGQEVEMGREGVARGYHAGV